MTDSSGKGFYYYYLNPYVVDKDAHREVLSVSLLVEGRLS